MRKSILSLAISTAIFSGSAMAASIEDKIDMLQDEIDQLKAQAAKADKNGGGMNLGSNSTLGGYGELHYNSLAVRYQQAKHALKMRLISIVLYCFLATDLMTGLALSLN